MTRIICTLCLLWSSLGLLAQQPDEIAQMRSLTQAPARPQWNMNHQDEFQLAFAGLFFFYKSFISSQDASRCNFTPSCSEYALAAIKQQGLLLGPINAFDRLSRCNSLNQADYIRHPETGMLYDPVEPEAERLPVSQ